MSGFDYISNPDESKEYWPRYRIFYIFLVTTFVIFTLRLWYLQVIQGNELAEFSEKNRIKQNKIFSPRGLFLDRDGKILVENLPGFEAILMPQYIESLPKLAAVVAPILSLEPEKLIQRVQKSRRQNGPFAQIRLKENLSREEVFRLKRIRLDTPGLEIRESIVRYYPLRQDGAQIFGYIAEISKNQIAEKNKIIKNQNEFTQFKFEQGDLVGKSGLEDFLDLEIRGQDGMSFIQVDAHGRETTTQLPNIYGEQIKNVESIHGNNAVLTLDRDLQEAAFNSIQTNQRIGALVAMKTNGEVLAWVSAPAFDPNDFSTGKISQTWGKIMNDPFKPLRNKVIQDHHSPGSTFKPFIALAALQEKVVTPSTYVFSPGVFWFGGRPYHDTRKEGHGNVRIFEALERSANVFFYKMGISLGVDKMYGYLTLLGMNEKSGFELGSRESKGLIPNSKWKKEVIGEEWQPGENLSTAIGQGFVSVTLLQMAMAYNTIATEGKLYRPFIVRKIISQDGQVLREAFPRQIRDVTLKTNEFHIDPETFLTVKEGLRLVANGERGTARRFKIPGVQMAGKTGTAQVRSFSADQIYDKCENRPIQTRHHGWYVAFAPVEKPEITVAALAEHSCHGSSGAGPLVHDVMLAYFKKYHPDLIEKAAKGGPGKQIVTIETTTEGE
jgi:penicillin-binding protein 2